MCVHACVCACVRVCACVSADLSQCGIFCCHIPQTSVYFSYAHAQCEEKTTSEMWTDITCPTYRKIVQKV